MSISETIIQPITRSSVVQKECHKCRNVYLLNEYYKKKGKYTNICKKCRLVYAKNYYELNKNNVLLKAKSRYAGRKKKS